VWGWKLVSQIKWSTWAEIFETGVLLLSNYRRFNKYGIWKLSTITNVLIELPSLHEKLLLIIFTKFSIQKNFTSRGLRFMLRQCNAWL
jgi:hypothetical protein